MVACFLKVEELRSPLLGEAHSLCHLVEDVSDEFVKLRFVLDDDRRHRPLQPNRRVLGLDQRPFNVWIINIPDTS